MAIQTIATSELYQATTMGSSDFIMGLVPGNAVAQRTVIAALKALWVEMLRPVSVTIASGVVTYDSGAIKHIVRTESGATDDLDTINGGHVGAEMQIFVRSAGGEMITVKHATGNIRLAGAADFTFTTIYDTIRLAYHGSDWVEVSRSINA